MTTFGLTTTGFVPEQFSDVLADISSALQTAFGASVALGNRTVFGQIAAIVSERLADLWAALEAVYSAQDPDKAAGQALDALCALTGTLRPAASASTVMFTLVGTPTTVVPAGTTAKGNSTGSIFASSLSAAIVAVAAWSTSTTYAVTNRVAVGGSVFQCTTGGVSASSGLGPTGTGSGIVDGTVQWLFLGTGSGAVDVPAACTVTGPVVAAAGDINNSIQGSVFGLSNIINVTDALIGRNIATDAELRILRNAELSAAGKSTINAIRAALLQLPTVLSATVFANNTEATDANGIPPHAICALVQSETGIPDDSQTIRDTLFANVAAGILTFASPLGTPVTGTSTDSQGVTHEIDFSRPATIPIYITVNVTYDATMFPLDGTTEVADAIAAFGQGLPAGRDAVAASLGARAFSVPGVLDTPSVLIGTSPSPSASTTIPISNFQIATYDTSRIIVNATPGTP